MGTLKQYGKQLKFNQKITIFVISVLVIPIIAFYIFIFKNIEASNINDKMRDLKVKMAQSKSIIEKNVEMCNMTTQVFLNSKNIMDYISAIKSGEEFTMQEHLEFYRNDIENLEKILNSNPYLYQIRVFVDSPYIIEMMPILYKYDRLKQLSWYQEGEIKSGSWKLDYDDSLLSEHFSQKMPHVVSLVTDISNYKQGKLGIIEVATKMDLMFPDIYKSSNDQWTCFIDKEGNYYDDKTCEVDWKSKVDRFLENASFDRSQAYYDVVELDGEKMLVAWEPIKLLDGYLLKVVSLRNEMQHIKQLRNVYLILLVFVLLVSTLLISFVVKLILRRLYRIMEVVHQAQKGDLSVRVSACGGDEIGELGYQLNHMLSKISELMEEGIQREVLIKESEIRALQNQINAHFIYNVLESIKMMAEVNEEYEISNGLTSLGKLLRYSMRWVSHNVTISEEIDYIRNYLALINLRFDYKIILSISMQDEMWAQEIPKMSLQPIIENAICHGIEELAEDTTIYIKSHIHETYCVIEITDAGKGMSEEQVNRLRKKIAGKIETSGGAGNGIGLKNVQDRIQISFGGEYGISVVSKEGYYTKVIVKIPYQEKERRGK